MREKLSLAWWLLWAQLRKGKSCGRSHGKGKAGNTQSGVTAVTLDHVASPLLAPNRTTPPGRQAAKQRGTAVHQKEGKGGQKTKEAMHGGLKIVAYWSTMWE